MIDTHPPRNGSPRNGPADRHSGSLDLALLELLLQEHRASALPRLERLWNYYRNPAMDAHAGHGGRRAYRLAQEQGLPARLTGRTPGAGTPSPVGSPGWDADILSRGERSDREVVIENDIAWRLHVMVDFMFGRPFALQSRAADPATARRIEAFLSQTFAGSGGDSFFQDLALLGSIYGYVDVLLRIDPTPQPLSPTRGRERISATHPGEPTGEGVSGAASRILLEVIEPPRSVPLLSPDDYRRLDAYIVYYRQQTHQVEHDGFLARLRQRVLEGRPFLPRQHPRGRRAVRECVQVWTDSSYAFYLGPADGRVLVERSVNRLGRLPVVHIQNLPQPFFYDGLSEVEPLIPLQDELNTRLSDRANRVTFQSFKMYLGKGIDGFLDRPVGPGQMWATDNPAAQIQEFGGDAQSPSEEAHIDEIREALDKASGVPPVAAGVLRDKVGSLTSENALRVVLMGLLARTQKKRLTYGAGIAEMCELALHAADVLGILPTRPEDRRVDLHWPSPLPEDQGQRLAEAQIKLQIGVPREQVLAELGYGGGGEVKTGQQESRTA